MTRGLRGSIDHFPSTHATWIIDTLRVVSDGSPAERDEAARQLRTHVMSRYREPLLAYATASSFRALSSPEELVHGFFAERLPDVEYLRTWTGTGMRLRRWLCNGLLLHMFGVAKQRRRESRALGAAIEAQLRGTGDTSEPAAAEAFERAWARGVLERATQSAEQTLRLERRLEAWDLFLLHAIEGHSYPRLAQARGVGEGEVRSAVRLAARRFRDAVAAEMIRDGVPPAEVDREAEAIMRVFGALGP